MELSPELRPIIEAAKNSALTRRMSNACAKPLITTGEVTPSSIAPVLAPDRQGDVKVFPMIWGYTIPNHTGPLFNARSETAGAKPTFAQDWKLHRCVVPASWYYEWEHLNNPATGKTKTGDRYLLQAEDARVTWLAGLYHIEDGFPHFVVLTRDSVAPIRFIHDRMPVILPKNAVDDWIHPSSNPSIVIGHAVTNVFFEKA